MDTVVQYFHVQLFKCDAKGKLSSPSNFDAQEDVDVHPPQYIVADGYSQDEIIELQPYWNKLISQRVNNYETTITIRETIIKFGHTMQLMNHYLLRFNLTYAFKA